MTHKSNSKLKMQKSKIFSEGLVVLVDEEDRELRTEVGNLSEDVEIS